MNKTIEQAPHYFEFERWRMGITKGKHTSVSDLYKYFIENILNQQSHAVSGEVEELAKEFANDIIGSLDWLDINGQTDWSNVYEAFKSGYAAAPQKGMKWAKATNAPIDGSYYCRFYNNGYIVMRGTCVVTDGKFNSDYDLNDIEWLDESPSPIEAGDGWSKEKPTFKEDCILLTASWWKDHWETKSFDIYQADGEDENGNPGWYWSVLQDGEECGDIEDLQADLYRVISFPAPPIQKTVK